MVDLFIVGGYFAFLLTVGWRARGGSADAYWVGARKYGVFPVSASLVATIFGASSTVGIIGLGYSRGLTGAWWSLVGGVALIPFAFFLAERVRGQGVYTLPDILHEAYGRKVSMLGAGFIGVAWCGVVAAQIVAGALLVGSVFAMEFQVALAGVTLVFVLYTLWGGQLSVVRTDSWQIFLFVGALLATLFLVVKTGPPAGALSGASLGALLTQVPEGHLSFPVSPEFGWYQVVVFYPLIVGMPYLVGPDIYSRILCAKDGGSARKAVLLAALAVIPLSLLLAGLGLLIRAQFPGLLPEEALPEALSALAPVGVKGFIVVGILGAIMSSADTTLISASTIVSLNVVAPLVGLGEKERLRLTRVLVVILGLVAWGIASFQREIIASLLLSYTVFVGGVAIPTLASFWRHRLGVTPVGAFWAVFAGGLTALLGEMNGGSFLRGILGEGGSDFMEMILGPEYGSILPVLTSAIVLVIVSRLSRRGGTVRGLGVLVVGVGTALVVGCDGGTSVPTPVPTCPSPGLGITVGGRLGQEDVSRTPTRMVVLMGGGGEDDEASTRFAVGAGGGDMVILRASGSTTSYPDYFSLTLAPSPSPSSVVTVLTSDPFSAGDPAVLCWVGGAEALWLAGGNQWDYLGRWPDTLHAGIHQANSRGSAIGGTSAGAMSLGEAAFDAHFGSVTASEALGNPLRNEVSLSYPSFSAPELHGFLVDTHFSQRGREGRLLAFLARFLQEKGREEVFGLGLDEGMALVIQGGVADVYGPPGREVWLYRVSGPAQMAAGEPLSLDGIERVGLGPGDRIVWPPDFGAMTSVDLRVRQGVVEVVSQ